ncbi:YpdA family putative bacillithiol disulfide reductase [Paenibacillus cymbidii]|uniref:YpdA family putative bacillithiol disulfide reductase n=1 Tax=Paenibacillus cymbidii TaxID=1639034 RepID=UPI0010802F1F|nr:YpdA family putative bacillithiol disulfide reductase [Paenibacillus cymbidii]
MEQAIVVGAGPCGLSAAIELQRIGLNPLVIEKNVVVHSIYQYPTYMRFFSTPELLEIGNIPFVTPHEKPSRQEALTYYRTVAERHRVRINSYETVIEARKQPDGRFVVASQDRWGKLREYETQHVVIATGYFDHPNLLGIPGETSPKVSHFFREAHPYTGTKVAIIGGSNSAIDAALELMRVGAEVTVVYRGDTYSPYIKPWVRPIFESMVNKGIIRMLFGSRVVGIDNDTVTVERSSSAADTDEQARLTFANDFVLALTGFRPDRSFLGNMGVRVEGDYDIPRFDPETMETNVEGLYVAGVVASGREANEVFIETGRKHGSLIAAHIAGKRS